MDRYKEVTVSFRLTNQNNPEKRLYLSVEAWYGMLELAEAHGWTPIGTGLPPWWGGGGGSNGFNLQAQDNWNGDYISGDGGLVMLEDALNLADALERAFWEYEPRFTRPVFEVIQDYFRPRERLLPGIGAIALTADFCRCGAFWIERAYH